MNGFIRAEWCRECEYVFCFSFRGNAITLSKTSAVATDNLSAELLEGCLRQFERDVALKS